MNLEAGMKHYARSLLVVVIVFTASTGRGDGRTVQYRSSSGRVSLIKCRYVSDHGGWCSVE